MEQPVNFIRTQVEVLSQKYTIRIDRPLTEASEFQEELATLRIANQNDCVHILLNGPGGSDVVMKAFLNAMAQSEAHIITEIEGQCCSALTMIFLAGDEFRVSDDSEFMIHTGSFGYSGKENNVREFVEFNAKSNSRLMHKYYKHYLTPDEIEQCINGRDFWMDADEIMERLEKRMELFQEEEAEFMKQFEEDEVEPYTKEDFEDKSKEEILVMLFGEDESSELNDVVTEPSGVMHFEEGVFELKVYSNGKLDCCDDEQLFTSFVETQDEFGVEDLKMYADLLGVKFPHNIGQDTLAQKLDDKVKEIVDSLNK